METTEKKTVKRNRKRLTLYEMMFEGRTFHEMSEVSGYDEKYLKNTFCPSGRWYSDYMLWANDKAEAIEKEVRLRIKKRTNEAMTVLEYALTITKTDPRTAVKAANSILDRGGFKAPEKVEISNPYDQAERLANWIEEKNKPKQPTNE